MYRRGILVMSGAQLGFRHELARRALLEALTAGQARRCHERMLECLLATHPERHLGRIVNHAAAAGRAELVARYGVDAAREAFDELCIQFPGRFTPTQYPALLRRVNRRRDDAHARGDDKWRGLDCDIFKDHCAEMAQCLEEQPDRTALELLVEFQARYPGRYSQRQLHTLQKRVRAWRQQAVRRLINEVSRTPNVRSIEA